MTSPAEPRERWPDNPQRLAVEPAARALSLLVDGLAFPEGPRWHDGRLWFSDMHDHHVCAVDAGGRLEKIAEVPNWPSGLGWLPDGSLLAVSMTDRRLLRREGDAWVTHADLSELAAFHCNDMVVDARGRAYVGNFGFDLDAGAAPQPTALIRVDPDGHAEIAAQDMRFPNGAVVTPDGGTLVVGESFGACLTAFDIGEDGTLSKRRTWAALEGAVPDGICLDAEGAIWVASPVSNEVLRVEEGGHVSERIPTEQLAIACMLGGPERRTLYVLTSETTRADEAPRLRSARILTTEVDVPGDGLP